MGATGATGLAGYLVKRLLGMLLLLAGVTFVVFGMMYLAPGDVTVMLAASSPSPEQVAAMVPEEYWLGDKDLYIKAFNASRESYSTDGNIDEASMKSALNLLTTTDPSFDTSSIDLSKTFDGSFLARAKGQ